MAVVVVAEPLPAEVTTLGCPATSSELEVMGDASSAASQRKPSIALV